MKRLKHEIAGPRVPQRGHPLRVVAVSGGIGSGKSTVCEMLAALGARIFNADETAKNIMESDAELRSQIATTFGNDSFRGDGSLNRPFLARAIFGSATKRLQMNALVHPRVAAAFRAVRAEAERDEVRLLVHESALITEVKDRNQFDAIVIVESPLSERIGRVTRRDASTVDSVASRIDSQPTPQEFRRVADYIIVNDGSLTQLRERVESVFGSIVGDLPSVKGT